MKKKNIQFTSTNDTPYEQNLAVPQGAHISNVTYAKAKHSPLVTSICGCSSTFSGLSSMAPISAHISGSSIMFSSGYHPEMPAYIPLSSAGFYYQFASACRTKGGKYLAASLMAASLLQGMLAPYALAFTSEVNGTVIGEVVSGGTQTVNTGGTANSTTINSGGTQRVSSGGLASSTTINSGGRQTVSSGGLVSGTIINWLGQQFVYNDGTDSGAIVNSGGRQFVYNDGTVNSATVNSGGKQYVNTGGTANSTTINNSGTQFVSSGGTAHSTSIDSGGRQFVYSDGTASGTTIDNFGEQHISGGTAHNTTINSGGRQFVYSDGTASGTTINSGGEQRVRNGGTASGTTISSGGTQTVSSGAIISGTTVNSGGQQRFVGATATHNVSGNVLNSGATQMFLSGAVASGAVGGTVTDGITQVIELGGSAVNVTVSSGGTQNVSNGGTAFGTTVNSYGRQYVRDGGVAHDTTVNSGGTQHIESGGIANGTIINTSGRQTVFSGGIANDAVLYENQTISSGGTANRTTIYAGANQNIQSGGVANSAIVNGGIQNVSSGATAFATEVHSGFQHVFSGGVVSSATISGGRQLISSGGVVTGTVVSAGYQDVSSGGTAISTQLSGGSQYVNSGGIASGTIVGEGSFQEVRDGGTAISSTINSGGTLTVSTGGMVTSTLLQGGTIAGNMTYNAGQTLQGAGGTITGDVVFAGGTFIPELDAANPSGNVLIVSGSATGLSSGTIAPIWQNGQAGTGEQTYTVLSAGTALTETFGTQVDLVKATYTQEVSGNELLLKVVEKTAAYQGYSSYLSPNGQSLAVVLDTLDANKQLPKLMTALGNLPAQGDVVAEAVMQLIPESFSTAQSLNQNIVRAFMAQRPTMAEGKLQNQAPSTTSQGVASLESGVAAGSEFSQNAWQFFGAPFGFTASQQSSHEHSGYDMTAGGVNLGIVRHFDNYWLGASLGYSNQYLKMKDVDANIHSDQLMFNVFGGVRQNDFFAEAALGYAHTWNYSSRNVGIGTGSTAYHDELTANYGQESFLASLTLGYIFEFDNNFRIIPSIGVDYVHTYSHAFKESGGDAALGTDASSFNSVQIPVSVTLEKSFVLEDAIITPSLTASWRPELGDTSTTTHSNFVNASSAGSFTTQSQENARHAFAFGAGLDMQFYEDFGLGVNYELHTKHMYTSHSIDVEFTWEF